MAENNSGKKEILLIVVGALISGITAMATDYLNDKEAEKEANIQKKMDLNSQLSDDIGKRFYLTFELYRNRRDKDSALPNTLSQFKETEEQWNLKIYSYQSLLQHYYGRDVKQEFLDSVFNPLVELGRTVKYLKRDTSHFVTDYMRLDTVNTYFIGKIYDIIGR